jgi:rhomboid-like protein
MFKRFYQNHNWIRIDERKYLFKNAIFTCGVIAGSFGLANYIDSQKQQSFRGKFNLSRFSTPLSNSNANQKRKRMIMHIPILGNAYVTAEQQWNSLKPYQKTIYCLIALNGIVYTLTLSRSSKLQTFLNRHFVNRFHAPHYTNVTSAFAHSSLTHLGFNMLALYSFGTFLHQLYGKEQFLAMYVSSAAFSSFTSLLCKFAMRNFYQGSLGASGAIYSILGNMFFFKNIKVSLIFFPFLHIPLQLAIAGLLAFDTTGLLKRLTRFDHGAHIGGLAFGLAYHRFFSHRPGSSSPTKRRQ